MMSDLEVGKSVFCIAIIVLLFVNGTGRLTFAIGYCVASGTNFNLSVVV